MGRYILLRHREIPDLHRLEVYMGHGGYEAWRKALTAMTPEQVIEEVKASGLRGRGGAGFPTGIKWSFVPKDVFPKYVVVNADESEPGTFKDREIIEGNPHQLIEGALLAAYAIQAERVYIYVRGEYRAMARRLEAAIAEAYAAGLIGRNVLGTGYSVEMFVHLGAGAYICGEETALLESLEGKIGHPRMRPPFPATHGLYGQPTVVNNVETLANVPPIVLHGAAWYRTIGTQKSPGPKIFCLSGRVRRPGNYEAELGKITFRDLIFGEEYGQGLLEEGRTVKAILPSGASAPMLPASALDTPLDYESVQAAGSILGSASIIVLDNTVDIVWAAHKMTRFFQHESCGKCTPCREGTYWLRRVYERIAAGHGRPRDVELLEGIARQMAGKTLCLLGDFATSPVLSSLKHFRKEYEACLQRAIETPVGAPA
ncbi:MAG: NADH-quinone oxidoreductase subunit NuoF [Thermoflexus sp.]|jgi:NADH-quinone oxidoreductase subunit F|nr:NADH-quinone oxidoreductase subunit NuoF [Thermoflexus sp.]